MKPILQIALLLLSVSAIKQKSEATYGDITVHVKTKIDGEPEILPDRYSKDSDDTLMNMLISKGYAFSSKEGGEVVVGVDCGCNCQCCFGQSKFDLWEVSKDCGCDCNCCHANQFN